MNCGRSVLLEKVSVSSEFLWFGNRSACLYTELRTQKAIPFNYPKNPDIEPLVSITSTSLSPQVVLGVGGAVPHSAEPEYQGGDGRRARLKNPDESAERGEEERVS